MPNVRHVVPAVEPPVYYPVLLDLRGRLAVVIGGGAVASAKVRGLLEAGARVLVVSPSPSPSLARLAETGAITVAVREYRQGDLAGATIAIAATDDRAMNGAVWEEAEAAGVPLNAVDDVPHCHFIAPSVLRRGRIVVSVSSSGTCPALAVRLRERIASVVREEHGALADGLGALRPDIARRVPDLVTRTRAWYHVVDALIDPPWHPAAWPDEAGFREMVLSMVGRIADGEGAPAAIDARPSRLPGTVHLVGAGPGDPGLLTRRGFELLRSADVVVHDRLISHDMLALATPGARLVDVGKLGHGPASSQERINAILIAEARDGHRVVRLKGGDPFVFGRGAEEVAALAAAGVACEVVPGVTSAVAAPAAAGIPVTHREFASAFAVVTAEQSHASPVLDWGALARMPTLIVLMGLRALHDVTRRLIGHGACPEIPAAVISAATLPTERVVVGTLGSIAEDVAAASLTPPATLIVGEVVRFHSGTIAQWSP